MGVLEWYGIGLFVYGFSYSRCSILVKIVSLFGINSRVGIFMYRVSLQPHVNFRSNIRGWLECEHCQILQMYVINCALFNILCNKGRLQYRSCSESLFLIFLFVFI